MAQKATKSSEKPLQEKKTFCCWYNCLKHQHFKSLLYKKKGHTIRVATMEKAAVKSFQEMGSRWLRLKSSRMSIRKVVQKLKLQVNKHQVQKEKL